MTYSDYWSSAVAQEKASGLQHEEKYNYVDYHAQRYKYAFDLCRRLWPDPDAKILDVGRSPLSKLLARHYHTVCTLGFPLVPQQANEDPPLGKHYPYDLNSAEDGLSPVVDDQFDVIVFAETIEHLHAAPELVLFALSGLLTPGGILVCQTPNAVALHRRLALLAGRHPYERIRLDKTNPGHIREYSRSELIEIGRGARLDVLHHEFNDYFGAQGSTSKKVAIRLLKLLAKVVPSFGRGQTIVFKRQIDSHADVPARPVERARVPAMAADRG